MNLLCLLLLGLVLSPVPLLAGPDESSSAGHRIPIRGAEGIDQPGQQSKPYVLLISIDGFRAEYLDRFDLPNFRRVIREGVRADGLIPVFPSVTAPNHYSIVTGLYPERHGIVGNTFYDADRGQVFNHKTHSDGTWYRGHPLWVIAETQGMTTACYLWIGCEADIYGIRPSYLTTHDDQTPSEARADQVLSWLQLPVDQPSLRNASAVASSHRSSCRRHHHCHGTTLCPRPECRRRALGAAWLGSVALGDAWNILCDGPSIKQGVRIPAFENVHIYPFLAEVLNLETPPDIDGRAGWLRHLIAE